MCAQLPLVTLLQEMCSMFVFVCSVSCFYIMYLIFEKILFSVGIPTTLPAPCVVALVSNGESRVRFNLKWAAECSLVPI